MNNKKTKRIAILGVMTALLLVVFTLETVIGSLWITPPAVLSLSILFVICFSFDFTVGVLSGLMFGVCSFIIALIVGNPLFILPWISILPRLFVGISAYGVFALMKKICKNSDKPFVKEVLPYSLGAVAGIIVNTLTVIVALTFLAPAEYGNTFIGWVQILITLNFPIEIAGALILTPILVRPVKKFLKGEKQ